MGAQNAIFAVTKVEFCMQTQGPRSWGLKNSVFRNRLCSKVVALGVLGLPRLILDNMFMGS